MSDELLTAREAAKLLGCCARQLLRWATYDHLTPAPDNHGRFRLDDILVLKAQFEAKRQGRR